MKSQIEKAEVLLESLPYLRRFFGKTMVIKYGGNAMTNAALQESFAQDVVLLKFVGMNPVIVHGGGPQIDAMLAKLGIQPRFVRGMRVTDPPTMDVVEMVLVGKVNREIVGMINRHGGRAVGLSGKDGELIMGRKMTVRDGADDLGMVGDVANINPRVIECLDSANFIPVIAPVGVGPDGETYNINADIVAGKIAQALRAEKLILLTDVEGIKNEAGKLVSTLASDEAERMIEAGIIHAGMIPKVECAIEALRGGVVKTHIVDGRVRHAVLLEIFTTEGVGTQVLPRPATPTVRPLRHEA